MRFFKVSTLVFLGLLFGLILGIQWLFDSSIKPPATTPTIGSAQTLSAAYNRWKMQAEQNGADRKLVLPLAYSKALSSKYTPAGGLATLDLVQGTLLVEVSGLSDASTYDVGISDTRYAQKDAIIIGQLVHEADRSTLQAQLSIKDLRDFTLNQVVIFQTGQSSEENGLLYASPSLFQRLYYEELRGTGDVLQTANLTQTDSVPSWLAPFSFLIPSPAYAQEASTVGLTALIAQGEALFFNETFGGNGRTCGTCHRAENNFTIDPAFIATLPGDDLLFIAELNEDLAELEDPTLLREFGLIRANVDGFEDPTNKFVMRSVPHMLGMSLSIQAAAETTEPPLQMTGWSGDGAPGSGTLREFALGAVTQHFPKTLDRIPDEDFRLPTDAELDAIEAFTLSLGRQKEMNFETMELIDSNAERGRILFITEDSDNRTVQAAKCNICHRNGGALTVAGVNQNFDTGVENMLHPAAIAGWALPRDGGFGTQLDESTGGFGDGNFNTASLVEVADTAPYFHHNGATTLEDAIAFYDSPEFRNSIEGQRLMLQDSGGQEMAVEVDVLAAFLRVVNALDNIRAITDFLARSKFGITVADSQNLLNLAQEDLNDAITVLNQSELHEEDGVIHLEAAQELVDSAADAENTAERDDFIDQAIAETQAAKSTMVIDSGPDTTSPTATIVFPVQESEVTGIVTIVVDASDNIGVDAVVFAVGGIEIGQDFAAPFEHGWDTSLSPEGINQITVTAVDGSGNTKTATTTVTVTHAPPLDTVDPIVAITAPASGEAVLGTITIAADASDDVGIERVIFMVGSTEIGQSTAAPFNMVFNTTTIANSTAQITAMAVDTSGNSSVSSISVAISNVQEPCTVYSCPTPPPAPTDPPPPPTIPTGSSPDGEFEGEVISKDSNASTVTVSTESGSLTLKVTSSTDFKGSIVNDFNSILVGHVAQGEFFTSVGEVLWIEADLPPGL